MICKRGSFVIQRHSELRDLEADLFSMVCNDVEVKPVLQGITEEQLSGGFNRAQDARLDQDQEPQQIYRIPEHDKKRLYSRRVLDVEHGSFTPLAFTTTGGMGKECIRYHSGLAELVATRQERRTLFAKNLLDSSKDIFFHFPFAFVDSFRHF